MYPVLFEIGGVTITSFGVMMFLSFLAGAWVLSRQLQMRGFDPELAWDFLLWVAVGGIVGAKLYYNLLHFEELRADPLAELTNRAGLVWYGGLIGGVLAYYWQVKRRGLPLAPMFDATAPSLFLAYAIGRMGCFLVGDDYGLPTDSWVGIAFPNGAPPSTAGYLRTVGADIPASVPDSAILAVHPTQLYEVAAALVLFGVLLQLSKRGLRSGRLFALYLAFYGVERFLVEFVRAKSDRLMLGLSTSQLASILLLALAAFIWTRARGGATPPETRTARPGSGAARVGAG
ncbi:MAG TPA: prolipoprotein diacylglyceryl transferase [Longimicrobiales bacterium]|nr:prolipoprotein diacylglyceryl transferase [Longimicrobiales bacterium]